MTTCTPLRMACPKIMAPPAGSSSRQLWATTLHVGAGGRLDWSLLLPSSAWRKPARLTRTTSVKAAPKRKGKWRPNRPAVKPPAAGTGKHSDAHGAAEAGQHSASQPGADAFGQEGVQGYVPHRHSGAGDQAIGDELGERAGQAGANAGEGHGDGSSRDDGPAAEPLYREAGRN